jgi:hypothetical protein
MPRRRRSGLSTLKALISSQVETLVSSIVQVVRENTVNEIGALLASSAMEPGVRKPRTKRRRKLDLTCIEPKCENRSKGPRFRFLCEQHLGASKKQVMAWRAARRKG